jgi:transcriptional regulator with XRE-family HTH domain
MSIGENIKKIRNIKGLTQKELAAVLDVTSTTIQNYENNRREPNLNMIKKISAALGVPATDFFTDAEVEKMENNFINSVLTKSEQKQINFMTSLKTENFQTLVKALETDFDELTDKKINEMISLQVTLDLYPLVEIMIKDKIKELISVYADMFPNKQK